MIVFQSIFVYSTIFIVLYSASKVSVKHNTTKPLIMALLFYATIFGLRYGVGTDFFAYKDMYESALSGHFETNTEFGFGWLISSMASIKLPTEIFFGLVAFLQILFVFLSEKGNTYSWPYLVFTFVIGVEWLQYANILRQVLAFSFFAFSLKKLEDRQILRHYLFILLAILMHKSALILILACPLYLLFHRHFSRIAVQIILLSFSIILGNVDVIATYLDQVEQILMLTGYDSYLMAGSAHNVIAAEPIHKGIGFIVGVLLNILLIVYSNTTKDFVKSDRFSFIYDLYFIGACVFYAFIYSRLITRIDVYFYGFQFIVGAYTLYVLRRKNKRKSYLFIMALYLLLFVGTLYRMFDNESAFYFIWQSDQFVGRF